VTKLMSMSYHYNFHVLFCAVSPNQKCYKSFAGHIFNRVVTCVFILLAFLVLFSGSIAVDFFCVN